MSSDYNISSVSSVNLSNVFALLIADRVKKHLGDHWKEDPFLAERFEMLEYVHLFPMHDLSSKLMAEFLQACCFALETYRETMPEWKREEEWYKSNVRQWGHLIDELRSDPRIVNKEA